MSELRGAQQLLDAADRAATAGDLTSAYDLLSGAAALQEATLGSAHPDLASTLNNLAIVAERTGRLSVAESHYRRAAAIASATCPADHPLVVESLRNLIGFCHAQQRPVYAPAGTECTAEEAQTWLNAFPREDDTTPAHATPNIADGQRTSPLAPLRPVPRGAHGTATHVPGSWHAWPLAAIVGLLVGSLGLVRVSPRGDAISTPATGLSAPSPSRDAHVETLALTALVSPTPPDRLAPPSESRVREQIQDIAATLFPARPAATIVLTDAQLCRGLTTTSEPWRCHALADDVDGQRLVLFTRVRTTLPTEVEHRWFRGGSLVQSVPLHVAAGGLEGYRTYSQQTVTTGVWTVEARTHAGDLLYERAFEVR